MVKEEVIEKTNKGRIEEEEEELMKVIELSRTKAELKKAKRKM